ncbi:TIGR04338 family metallohydrolase [Mycobacterium lepromatosis]|uniref:TIGR04338 family metallohydrolase n=1 Tax=Mycobacterium lepromatosis TaxID=480418 RepID=A0A0F4ENJ5_9MYCO|nr:TIGR04338 family metallohydrolase [Mycobacterium lepromatosis]KJX74546.1 hypothetical protein MLPM_2605 [Mycobacterium lepromatosis]UKN42934.1 TIGR04338 family metallohydrolase [Mycobacterium lepromatosis]
MTLLDPVRDTQRSKVYAAEEFIRKLFDRTVEHGSPAVEFFGAHLTLPPEARFGSVAAVQRYVDDVLALPAARQQWPRMLPLTVRARRAATAAHYENLDGAGVIALPGNNSHWAMRELVVLHEVAHHLCQNPPPHGPEFVATVCALTELVMGPELGHVFRVVYAQEGVR